MLSVLKRGVLFCQPRLYDGIPFAVKEQLHDPTPPRAVCRTLAISLSNFWVEIGRMQTNLGIDLSHYS